MVPIFLNLQITLYLISVSGNIILLFEIQIYNLFQLYMLNYSKINKQTFYIIIIHQHIKKDFDQDPKSGPRVKPRPKHRPRSRSKPEIKYKVCFSQHISILARTYMSWPRQNSYIYIYIIL